MRAVRIRRPAASQPPLVLLHGFLGSPHDWEPVIPSLAPDRDLVLCELPGHGATPAEGSLFSWAGLREGFQQLCKSEYLREYILGGYSMGGRIALDWVGSGAAHPDALILESTSGGIPDNERATRLKFDLAWAERFRTEDPRHVLRDWYAQSVFSHLAHAPGAIDALCALRARDLDHEGIARAMEVFSVARQPDLSTRWRDFDRPVLALAGGRDTKYAASMPGLASCFSLGSSLQVDGAGHNIHREAPDAWLQAVNPFLHTLHH